MQALSQNIAFDEQCGWAGTSAVSKAQPAHLITAAAHHSHSASDSGPAAHLNLQLHAQPLQPLPVLAACGAHGSCGRRSWEQGGA